MNAPDDNRGQTHNLVEQRKEKIKRFLLKDYNGIAYIALAIVTWLAVKIRTSNLGGLRDVTTGGWTLGPDLDPWLFHRWAEYIVEHGSLYANDAMRYVPLGFDTTKELLLHPYMIAWFHSIASVFGSTSVTQSAALFPAVIFGLTVIAFFFLVRRTFTESLGSKQANVIAVIASFFLSTIPTLIPRTVAGIPEKESPGFLFLFLTFYLFLVAWQSKTRKLRLTFATLAGATTAMMALVWGGYVYLFVTIGLAVFLAFILGQVNREKAYLYGLWLLSSSVFMFPFSERYHPHVLLSSATTGFAFGILFIIIVHQVIFSTSLRKRLPDLLRTIPKPLASTIIAILLGIILTTAIFGLNFVPSKATNVFNQLVKPVTDRLGSTVAENRQPFFQEWSGSFGPIFKGTIPLFFWLFFTGSVYLFYHMLAMLKKKERIVLTLSYLFFLVAIIFSRYASSSQWNGTNTKSLLLYAAGFIVFGYVSLRYWLRYHKKGEAETLRKINFSLLLLFSFFFFSIISARGAVRLIMVLVAPASIIVGYLMVNSFLRTHSLRKSTFKTIAWIFVAIILLAAISSGNFFYKAANGTAQNHVPGAYNQQWQKAMSWVRTNTPASAVFSHWWDYGYWVQSIGLRATVLDGGNAISYWNHLMGRHVLTGTNPDLALEFLKTHESTHLLIDPTDIGKYSAFSLIGSDETLDRASFLPTFTRNNQQTSETKDTTRYLYQGGASLDEDIIIDLESGQKLFLPAGKAGVAGLIIDEDAQGNLAKPVEAVFVYQGQQYRLALRYAHHGKQFHDFGQGVEAGVFLMPRLNQNQNQFDLERNGALIYLSPRVVQSQLARLYLYKEQVPGFTLVHSELDIVGSQVRNQGSDEDIVFFNGIRAPIRIWEISYPSYIKSNPAFLEKNFPDTRLAFPS